MPRPLKDKELIRFRENLGKRIRELRLQQGLSQEKLALKGGIHRAFWAMIERGEKAVRVTTLCRVAKIFNLTFSEMMEGLDTVDTQPKPKKRG